MILIRKVIKYLIKQLGRLIFKGNSIVNIGLPLYFFSK